MKIFKSPGCLIKRVFIGDNPVQLQMLFIYHPDQLLKIPGQGIAGSENIQFLLLDDGKVQIDMLLADTDAVSIPAEIWAELTNLCADNKINRSAPAKILEVYREKGGEVAALVKELGLEQVQDTGLLNAVADEVIAANPKAVADYKAGKEAAIKALMGQVMKRTKGAANPVEATELLKEKLAKL